MSSDPNAHFDQTVLDLIEHSPTGAVPSTPAYQDALKRLYASHQAYADADHKDGHVTARSLTRLPVFHADNLDALIAGQITPEALETNASIYSRYVQSLPADRRPRAETSRLMVAGKPVQHRAKHVGDAKVVAHDPLHTLFLVPGTGPHPGIAGNYLYGFVLQVTADAATSPWTLQVHDSDDGVAQFETATLPAALAKLQEVLASAPFNLDELESLDFRLL